MTKVDDLIVVGFYVVLAALLTLQLFGSLHHLSGNALAEVPLRSVEFYALYFPFVLSYFVLTFGPPIIVGVAFGYFFLRVPAPQSPRGRRYFARGARFFLIGIIAYGIGFSIAAIASPYINDTFVPFTPARPLATNAGQAKDGWSNFRPIMTTAMSLGLQLIVVSLCVWRSIAALVSVRHFSAIAYLASTLLVGVLLCMFYTVGSQSTFQLPGDLRPGAGAQTGSYWVVEPSERLKAATEEYWRNNRAIVEQRAAFRRPFAERFAFYYEDGRLSVPDFESIAIFYGEQFLVAATFEASEAFGVSISDVTYKRANLALSLYIWTFKLIVMIMILPLLYVGVRTVFGPLPGESQPSAS